jgi:hypothetical protein
MGVRVGEGKGRIPMPYSNSEGESSMLASVLSGIRIYVSLSEKENFSNNSALVAGRLNPRLYLHSIFPKSQTCRSRQTPGFAPGCDPVNFFMTQSMILLETRVWKCGILLIIIELFLPAGRNANGTGIGFTAAFSFHTQRAMAAKKTDMKEQD